jgi:hypothetical protein
VGQDSKETAKKTLQNILDDFEFRLKTEPLAMTLNM